MDDTPRLLDKIFKRQSLLKSPEQVLGALKQAHQQHAFDGDTLQRLEKSLLFNQLLVRDAMVSRANMKVIKKTKNIEEIIDYIVKTAHSRFPVIGDDKDTVLGILHAKDLLKYAFHQQDFDLEHLLRPAIFVPESKTLHTLLKEFQEHRNHMAIVIDEYGGVSGLVTFEDLIEQIVGKIEDEFDQNDNADNITPIAEQTWRVKATTEISDFNEFFQTDYESEEADTIAGLLIERLGYVPEKGEKIIIEPFCFIVEQANKRRLQNLVISIVPQQMIE